jgi:hypothetical protein
MLLDFSWERTRLRGGSWSVRGERLSCGFALASAAEVVSKFSGDRVLPELALRGKDARVSDGVVEDVGDEAILEFGEAMSMGKCKSEGEKGSKKSARFS